MTTIIKVKDTDKAQDILGNKMLYRIEQSKGLIHFFNGVDLAIDLLILSANFSYVLKHNNRIFKTR